MPPVTSDKDFPKLLDNPSKQVKRTKALILKHLGVKTKHVDRPPIQGMFSRTFFVTTSENKQIVVQFRTEILDVSAFAIARSVLGEAVPEAKALTDFEVEEQGAWAYSLSLIPGKPWLMGVAGKGATGRIAINRSLGRIFSKGFLAPSSEECTATVIRPHLEAILKTDLEEVQPFLGTVKSFLDRLDDFARLPLWVSHYDLNQVNVMVDENCEVTGLVDWELSRPLPFAVGLGRIHTLAGEITEGLFWQPPEFVEAETAFWDALYGGMPEEVRSGLENQKELVKDAVLLGTVLQDIGFENGQVICGEISRKALPKLLTYRTPALRGQEPPYLI